jgi:endogenous inhibitor of DNA gyrase (YacG/DUF329 family)
MECKWEYQCPICRKPVEPPDESAPADPSNPFPFCSDRCRLVDLGRWFDGKYQIPVVEDDEE